MLATRKIVAVLVGAAAALLAFPAGGASAAGGGTSAHHHHHRTAASAHQGGAAPDLAPPTPGAAGAAGSPPSADAVEDYLSFVTTDLNTMWVGWFAANGHPRPDVAVRIIGPGDTFRTSCSDDTGERPVVTADFGNLFYCPSDTGVGPDGRPARGGIALPVLSLQRMWTGDILGTPSRVAGDFAAAVSVAHEFGHSVMDELQTDLGTAPPTGKNNELIADCLAGVWTEHADEEGILETGDFEEGAAALAAVGDAGMTDDPHGTPAERVRALTTGFNAGNPQACFDAYWH